MLITGCSRSDGNKATDAEVTDKEITYMYVDWPYYQSVDSLVDAASNVFEGKITNIFFDTINIRTGQPEKQSDDISSVMIYTIYEIDVTNSYKGVNGEKCM